MYHMIHARLPREGALTRSRDSRRAAISVVIFTRVCSIFRRHLRVRGSDARGFRDTVAGSSSSMEWRRLTDRKGFSSSSEEGQWLRPVGLRISNSSPLPSVFSILLPDSTLAELV